MSDQLIRSALRSPFMGVAITPTATKLAPTVLQRAVAILRRFGTDAHVYLPGIGTLNGLTAGNYLDSALTTPGAVDNPVGGVVDAVGTINATQATTANKPILRLTSGKYSWQFDGSNDTLALGSVPFQLADDHCVIAGASNTKAAGAGVVFALAGAAVQRIAQIYYSSTVPTFSWVDDATVSVTLSGGARTVGTVQVLTGRKSDTTYTSRVNGVAVGSSVLALGTTTVNSQSIGAHKATPANFHQGSIGPVIAIKGTVTDAELLTLERFVSSLTPSGPVF